VSARDRLKAAFNEGRIWGEPADLDELINDTIAEALTDPAFHHELTAMQRRDARPWLPVGEDGACIMPSMLASLGAADGRPSFVIAIEAPIDQAFSDQLVTLLRSGLRIQQVNGEAPQ
jgi:hypothetical protein